MRVKSIADAREKLGPGAAAQIEATLQRDIDEKRKHLKEIDKMVVSREQVESEMKADMDKVLAKRNKYGNIPTQRHGIKFDSKLEADVYDSLCAQFGEGGVIRQVSIPLSNGKRIRPDFMIIHSRNDDGTFIASLLDAKGMPTATWTAKANHFEDKYGIEIQLRGKK